MTPEPDDPIDRMRRAKLRVRECEAAVQAAQSRLREARATLRAAKAEDRKVESEWLDPQSLPLFEAVTASPEPGNVPPGQPASTVGHGLGLRAMSETQANAAPSRIEAGPEPIDVCHSAPDSDSFRSDLRWLTNCPAGDVNFRCAVHRAGKECLLTALDRKLTKTARKAIEAEIRRREKAAAKEANRERVRTAEGRALKVLGGAERGAVENGDALCSP